MRGGDGLPIHIRTLAQFVQPGQPRLAGQRDRQVPQFGRGVGCLVGIELCRNVGIARQVEPALGIDPGQRQRLFDVAVALMYAIDKIGIPFGMAEVVQILLGDELHVRAVNVGAPRALDLDRTQNDALAGRERELAAGGETAGENRLGLPFLLHPVLAAHQWRAGLGFVVAGGFGQAAGQHDLVAGGELDVGCGRNLAAQYGNTIASGDADATLAAADMAGHGILRATLARTVLLDRANADAVEQIPGLVDKQTEPGGLMLVAGDVALHARFDDDIVAGQKRGTVRAFDLGSNQMGIAPRAQ